MNITITFECRHAFSTPFIPVPVYESVKRDRHSNVIFIALGELPWLILDDIVSK